MAAKRKRTKAPEPLPTIGGRYLGAAALIGAMVIIPNAGVDSLFADYFNKKFLPPPTDKSKWKVGETTDVRLTLVTADKNLLSCAQETEFEGVHCAFKDEKTPWPRDPAAPLDDNKVTIIQPYRTSPDNQLVLVSGVWADPAVAMRFHKEPPYAVPQRKLARFVAHCTVKFVGEFPTAKLRWRPGAPWQNETKVLVAKATKCRIGDT